MPAFYSPHHRTLQDQFGSRALADTLEAATVQPVIDEDARTFIESRAFFFLSTVSDSGHRPSPTRGRARVRQGP